MPKVLRVPKVVDLPLGERGSIECQVMGNPPVTHIEWQKDGDSLRVSKS